MILGIPLDPLTFPLWWTHSPLGAFSQWTLDPFIKFKQSMFTCLSKSPRQLPHGVEYNIVMKSIITIYIESCSKLPKCRNRGITLEVNNFACSSISVEVEFPHSLWYGRFLMYLEFVVLVPSLNNQWSSSARPYDSHSFQSPLPIAMFHSLRGWHISQLSWLTHLMI